MNKKITFIADFFLDEIFGGAELVNEEIIKELEKLGYQVSRVKCSNVTNEHLTENIFIEEVLEILYFIGTDVILIFFFSKKEIISASKKNLLDRKFWFLKYPRH